MSRHKINSRESFLSVIQQAYESTGSVIDGVRFTREQVEQVRHAYEAGLIDREEIFNLAQGLGKEKIKASVDSVFSFAEKAAKFLS